MELVRLIYNSAFFYYDCKIEAWSFGKDFNFSKLSFKLGIIFWFYF
jgi:hypothetical protein